MDNQLEAEFEYYLENQDKLVEQYNGKFVVIKGAEIIVAYDDELVAINTTKENHEIW
ncbi:MAG: hypothetical protein IIB73_12440, partial [Proteobacteria bacterium]|nr:hypothetical protein [Pseudomonadota bacterium]